MYATGNLFNVVTAVDQKPIDGIAALIAALEGNKAKFAVIQFAGSDDPIVLNREQVSLHGAAINASYGAAPDRWLASSEDDRTSVTEVPR
jgi:hypothetical protein